MNATRYQKGVSHHHADMNPKFNSYIVAVEWMIVEIKKSSIFQ